MASNTMDLTATLPAAITQAITVASTRVQYAGPRAWLKHAVLPPG
jgi:hypothetical protein